MRYLKRFEVLSESSLYKKLMDEKNFLSEIELEEKQEIEFIEDCLIELSDNKLRIDVDVSEKIIRIYFNTFDDIKMILEVLDRNKLRFYSELKVTRDNTFYINYILLK